MINIKTDVSVKHAAQRVANVEDALVWLNEKD